MKIKTERLWLRPIEEKDQLKLRWWRNSSKDNFFDNKEITEEAQTKWFKKYKGLPSGTDMMFIATTKGGEEIGTAAIYDLDTTDRTAKIGRILVIERYRGKGYAQEIVEGLCSFADETIRLHSLIVETDMLNDDAIAVYHRTGFRTVGQNFLRVSSTYLYRIIVIMRRINPNYDDKKPMQVVEVE
jgi:RimJ/RimL family protein N-acetyltransferase